MHRAGVARAPSRVDGRWISYALRGGVLLAGALILLGTGGFVITGSRANEPRTLHDLQAQQSSVTGIDWLGVLDGTASRDPSAMIELGELVLILTPTARVALTVALFLIGRDWLFVGFTAVVLALLVAGLSGAAI